MPSSATETYRSSLRSRRGLCVGRARRRRSPGADPDRNARPGRHASASAHARASRMEALHGLWTDAGLEGIETRAITVRRSFDSFDNFWKVSTARLRPTLDLMEADAIAELK